jgi:hypothetical protein
MNVFSSGVHPVFMRHVAASRHESEADDGKLQMPKAGWWFVRPQVASAAWFGVWDWEPGI